LTCLKKEAGYHFIKKVELIILIIWNRVNRLSKSPKWSEQETTLGIDSMIGWLYDNHLE
jgi:hypothetical protein